MENIVFRKGTSRDAAIITPLIHQNYNTKTEQDARGFFEKDIASGTNYVVAESSGRIVAFATWKEHDRPYHELAELHAIAVDDSLKGKGLSKILFEKLLEELNRFYSGHGHSLRKLYVLTHADNARAIRFYEKMGFRKEVVIPSHYYKDVDELIMSMYFR